MNGKHKEVYSENAERATLGGILTNPSAFVILRGFIRADDFFLVRHRCIWAALDVISARQEPIDFASVIGELEGRNQLDEVGGIEYLTRLLNDVTDANKAEYYGRHVQRLALRRRIASASADLYRKAHDGKVEFGDLLAEWDKAGLEVRGRSANHTAKPFRQLIGEYFDRVEHMMTHPSKLLGIPTGFRDLDEVLMGLQKTDLLIFAGRPGMGKSAFCGQVALNAARLGVRVGYITLEMGHEQVVNRIVGMDTGINLQRLRSGDLNPHEWSKFTKATGELSELCIAIDDRPALTPAQIRAQCYEWISTHGLDLLVVDYLQKMSDGNLYKGDRVQAVGYFARSLKDLAKELNIPVFCAAQLSRAVEQRQDKRPQLSDLRESGEIEQEADIVMFLYRDAYYNDATEFPSLAEVIIEKHRNGMTGSVDLHFERSTTRFYNTRHETIDIEAL